MTERVPKNMTAALCKEPPGAGEAAVGGDPGLSLRRLRRSSGRKTTPHVRCGDSDEALATSAAVLGLAAKELRTVLAGIGEDELARLDGRRLPLRRVYGRGAFATDDRSEQHKSRGVGYVYAHCMIDDHSRLAYAELHPDQRGETCAAVLRRAAAWMDEMGLSPTQAVMSDNALAYTRGTAFADALAAIGARQILIPPRTPRWNGKVERFIRTLDEERAHGRIWASSAERARALGSWIRYYNRRRPHSSIEDRPPISRVPQERGQYI